MASFGDYNRVNTNVTAMDAQLSLNKINRDLGDSRLRLSTGFKINNAEDDAAGFAIATKLKSRVAGLEQALQNVSDAKSILDIAEGSYGSILDNLIEMKSLATQAANGTIATGSDEMKYISAQLEALSIDISDVAKSTKFNGVTLTNSATAGTSADLNTDSQTLTFQVGEGTSDTMTVTLNDVDTGKLFGTTHASGTSSTNPLADKAISTNILADVSQEDHRGAIVITEGSVTGAEMRTFVTAIDTAINTMNSNMNSVGIDQRSLSGKEVNLTESITANSAARSRIMDTDFAKEQSNSIRLQILQQTATAALSQANMGPQAVLGFLG